MGNRKELSKLKIERAKSLTDRQDDSNDI